MWIQGKTGKRLGEPHLFAYTIFETSLTDEIKIIYQSQIITTIKTPSERVVTS
jgi:hypothetical protein